MKGIFENSTGPEKNGRREIHNWVLAINYLTYLIIQPFMQMISILTIPQKILFNKNEQSISEEAVTSNRVINAEISRKIGETSPKRILRLEQRPKTIW